MVHLGVIWKEISSLEQQQGEKPFPGTDYTCQSVKKLLLSLLCLVFPVVQNLLDRVHQAKRVGNIVQDCSICKGSACDECQVPQEMPVSHQNPAAASHTTLSALPQELTAKADPAPSSL